MKVYESNTQYDYSFPAVSLAYFLRYPNPYSRHVLSSDVIDRFIDPITKRLHTTRLHLKKSKVPSAILKLIPRGLAGPGGASQSYVLETSVVDVKEGWMQTESQNMEWTGILSVAERQLYRRQSPTVETWTDKLADSGLSPPERMEKEWTSCRTAVTFVSRLGQARIKRRQKKAEEAEDDTGEETPKLGFFAALSAAGIQRTVELVGVQRTKKALVNGKSGMTLILERLRNGGLVGVLDGMRQDRLEGFDENHWKQVWTHGSNPPDSGSG